jgi:hypothetical protein
LTIDELIWRGFAAQHRGAPAENAQVIGALNTALALDSAHAEGWAPLRSLLCLDQTHSGKDDHLFLAVPRVHDDGIRVTCLTKRGAQRTWYWIFSETPAGLIDIVQAIDVEKQATHRHGVALLIRPSVRRISDEPYQDATQTKLAASVSSPLPLYFATSG